MERVRTVCKTFYSGVWYPIIAALLILCGHCFGLELVFGELLLATIVLGCVFASDLRFLILPVFAVIFIVPVAEYHTWAPGYERYYEDPALLAFLIATVTLTVAAIAWFCVRHRKEARKLPRGGSFESLMLFCILLCFNGAFTSGYQISDLWFGASFLLVLPLMYFVFCKYIRFDGKTCDYLMKCLVIAGLVVLAELLYAYATTVEFTDGAINPESIVLGWGVWTNIGGMLTFLMPACFYFAASHRYGWIGFGLGLLEYLGVILSQSRGAMVVGSGVLALSLLYLFCKGKNRRQNRIFILILAVGAIGVCVLFREKFFSLFQKFREMGLNDNGRFDLWKSGWNAFLDHPVFGAGFYGPFYNEGWDRGAFPGFCHNTVLQLLGSAGIVGFGAYVFHRFRTVRNVLRKPEPIKLWLGISLVGLLTFSLIDVLFFKYYPDCYYAVMLCCIDQLNEKNS